MNHTTRIDSKLYSYLINGAVQDLGMNRTVVNELNVFPVPDGDTGDNMYMTMQSGWDVLRESECRSLGETAEYCASAMLEGARGNSGVILSQMFSGLAQGLEGKKEATIREFGEAFERGISCAYGAVSKPVEGTMLTVYRDGVRQANSKLDECPDLESYLLLLTDGMRQSLERTPELLPILKETGVVDSGGAGLCYIMEGMRKGLSGEKPETGKTDTQNIKKEKIDFSLFDENSELTYGYCTEFLLRLQTKKLESLVTDVASFDIRTIQTELEKNGNSLVLLKNGSIVKVHIHTVCPGRILDYMQKFGEFLTLKIENMSLQHRDMSGQEELRTRMIPFKKYATVCVSPGEGIKQFFRELGVDAVVDGGQSMNPSTHDFLNAFAALNAENILVFPGNSNIVMAAKQAAEIYQKAHVIVLPVKTIGQTYAALAELDTAKETEEEITEGVLASIKNVDTAMIATATRDMEKDGVKIHKGDYIGFTDDTIYADDTLREKAVCRLCEKLSCDEMDVLILLKGQSVDMEECEAIAAELEKAYPMLEVIPMDGGQPVYDYILILE